MIYIHHREIDGMWYAAAIEGEKIFATAFSLDEKEVLRSLLKSLPYNASFQMAEKPNQLSEMLLATLKSMFAGENVYSNFKLVMAHLPNYSRKVLGFLSKVPVGYVTTYNALAKAAGGSPRAVGRVMATNPFPPLIPCHRVVRSDFRLGGFGLGGVDVKREILKREDRGYREPSKMKVDGAVLAIFPVGFVRKD